MMKKNVFVLLFVITIIIGIATPAFAERLKYTGLARSEGGAVLASATVAVYLAGTTTPADVYEASSGGTSVNEVTTDSNGRWTFYADTTDYAFTQEYKVVVTKDGYSSITLDNIFILRLPTNAVGVLTNDGSGNYTWSASSFSESGDYSPTGTWDWSGATITPPSTIPTIAGDNTFTGSNTLSKVNAAGGSATALTMSGTLGEMDGSKTFRGIFLDYTNTGSSSHTVTDTVVGIYVNEITNSDAADYGIFVGKNWDTGIMSLSPVYLGGNESTSKGTLQLADLNNSDYVAITPANETTSYTLTLPASEPTGLLRADAGAMNTTSSIADIDISGGTASTVAVWDASQKLTSLSTQNVITTGYIDGGILVTKSTAATVTVLGMSGYYVNADDDVIEFDLPADPTNKGYCFANTLYAKAITVDPDNADYIIMDGVAGAAGESVVSTGAADEQLCVIGIDSSYWKVTSKVGTWAQETPPE